MDKKELCMQEEILELMKERKQYKQASDEDGKRIYKALRNKIKRECKKEREKWINKNYEGIKEQMKAGRVNPAYGRKRRFFRAIRNKINNQVDEKGEILSTKEKRNYF